jgi:heptosyltransferase-2
VADSKNNLLIVGPSWIGDMIMAQSLFISLRRSRPGVGIDVVSPAWSKPLLTRMPEVRESFELPVKHNRLGLAARLRVARRLRSREYGQAIVLPLGWKAALVPFLARVPRRTGYLGEFRFGLINDRLPLDASKDRPMVRRYLALGSPPGGRLPEEIPYPKIRVDTVNRRRLIDQLGLGTDRPIVGCMPGTEYGPAKAWPVERFGEVARRLADDDHQVWIFGSPGQHALGERIVAAAGGRASNLCGKTRIEDAVDLISLAQKVITNDSGLMHVAGAVGTRVIAIFGSSSPRYTPPLTHSRTVRYLGLDCSPCFERKCPLKHYRCLQEISADEVYAAARGD